MPWVSLQDLGLGASVLRACFEHFQCSKQALRGHNGGHSGERLKSVRIGDSKIRIARLSINSICTVVVGPGWMVFTRETKDR